MSCLFFLRHHSKFFFNVINSLYKAIVEAINIAEKIGISDVACLKPDGDVPPLVALPNVLSTIVNPEPVQGVCLASASISVQRAAVLTFQTWRLRSSVSDLVGVLFGKDTTKARQKVCHVIVANTFEEILESSKVQMMCDNESVKPVGIVLSGLADEARPVAEAQCKAMFGLFSHSPLCIFVSRSQCCALYMRSISIYIHIYIYIYLLAGVILNSHFVLEKHVYTSIYINRSFSSSRSYTCLNLYIYICIFANSYCL